MAKRVLRKAIEVVAGIAGVAFLLARVTDFGLTVMLCSVFVLFACGLVWLIFGLSEDTGFWPRKPDE
jgi:hypothetical protein